MLLSSSRKIAELEAKITELEATIADLESAASAVEELKTNLAAAKFTIAELTSGNADLSTKLEIANADVTTLKAKTEESDKKIAGGIVNGIAEAGVEAIASDPSAANAGANSPEGLIAEIQAISDPVKRTLFFRKNRAAIDAANRELHSRG